MSGPEGLKTPLYQCHVDTGARMVSFAGYQMPVQCNLGVMGEHNWTRTKAGLFDVSHMGQARLVSDDGRHETVASFLETLTAAELLAQPEGTQRYTQLLNQQGGIVDDLMVTRPLSNPGTLGMVVNASRKKEDYALIDAHLPTGITLEQIEDRGLIALQGPEAIAVLEEHVPGVADMVFMQANEFDWNGALLRISRSGYTGEDGYEISVPADQAAELWTLLSADDRVEPIGLGARDSLRLEAGMCLYGHDIDETTSPVEAGLTWSIGKRRREEGGFPGYERIAAELADGPKRRRVGIAPEGRAPAREGAAIQTDGKPIGVITSGGFGPTAQAPVAMGYVEREYASPGTGVELIVRGKAMAAQVVRLPFAPHRYVR